MYYNQILRNSSPLSVGFDSVSVLSHYKTNMKSKDVWYFESIDFISIIVKS